MQQHLLRIPGLVILALFIQTTGFSQQDPGPIRDDDSPRKYDEIVIRHKGGKDAKVTIEIKDGNVLVNGKPVSEYEDSTLSIHRRKVSRYGNNYAYSFSMPDIRPDMGALEKLRGPDVGSSWSFSNDNVFRSNRAMLGVGTEKNEDIKGAKVTQITKGSAAVKMGLQVGDVITKVDDEEINESNDLFKVIGGHDAGDKVTITYMRGEKEQKVTGELGKARDKEVTIAPLNMDRFYMPDMKEFNYFGNSLKFGIRAQDAEDGKGVKVLDVDDESTAAKAGIKEGDVITKFDGKDINSVEALTEAAQAAKEKISVKVSIVRDGKPQELDVKVPRRLRTADL